MDVRFSVMRQWPQKSTAPRHTRWYFKAGWDDTLALLDTELSNLRAEDVVIEAGLAASDIRIDGWPKSSASAPWHPGIVIHFSALPPGAAERIPLRYLTDAFEFWQHNVRAIALGLEALRKVDRYGITHSGEQYTGWAKLPAGGTTPRRSAERLVAMLLDAVDGDTAVFDPATLNAEALVADAAAYSTAWRRAASRLHPDVPGATREGWDELQRLRVVLDSHHGIR